MNVYFISGLGADRRAFERLKLPDKFSLHYLDWIPPLKKESLNNYAKRLAASIDITQPFAVVGLSMGGMVASAMTQFLPAHKTVLISSVGSSKEFPPLFKTARITRVYKLVPGFILHHPNKLAYWLFGARTKNEKAMMQYLISNSDVHFIKWAIDAILNWETKERPADIFHIHGNRDKILPYRNTRPDVTISDGSHFMVWTRAGEVSKALVKALS